MHHFDIGRFQGICQYAHLDAAPGHPGKRLGAAGRGHKIWRYQLQVLLGLTQQVPELLADHGLGGGLAQGLQRIVADQARRRPFQRQLTLHQLRNEGQLLQGPNIRRGGRVTLHPVGVGMHVGQWQHSSPR
ncbi:hypothetical protein D9M71_634960 [compost metagenome]